jgi:2-polyprenyl-3-methyl-5-hydroxy-6-metoxy-1,4-benzoquinol methylase
MVGHLTAIARTCASAPLKFLVKSGLVKGRVLDYGCGRGFDYRSLLLSGYDAVGFDPFWEPIDIDGLFDTVLCTFVLNVVSEEEQLTVLMSLLSRVKEGGTAFVTVRRDLPREGMKGRGCTQRWVECPEGFEIVKETKGFAIFSRRV